MPETGEYPFNQQGLDAARADQEAAGKRVFRHERWDEQYGHKVGLTLEEAYFGTLQGYGCEFFFYTCGETCVVTMRPSGPWPWASIHYIVSDDLRYEESVVRVMTNEMATSGNCTLDETRAMLRRVVETT